jgi:hypothetical protein
MSHHYLTKQINAVFNALQRTRVYNIYKFIECSTERHYFYPRILSMKAFKNLRVLICNNGLISSTAMTALSQLPFIHTISLSIECFTTKGNFYSPLHSDWKEKGDMLSSLTHCQSLTSLEWEYDGYLLPSQLQYIVSIPNLIKLHLSIPLTV